MPENAQTIDSIQDDVEALRHRFPRTADLYRETCSVMFFRYGITPTANSLYQLVRKGSMSVPTQALREFWADLRERARVDMQHADLPEQVKQSAGQLIGEIWSLARDAADDSMAALRQNAATEREAALAEKARLEEQAVELSLQLEDARNRAISAEAKIAQQREELSAAAAIQGEAQLRLVEMRSEIERLQGMLDSMSASHEAEIDRITGRVLQAEQRYIELEKRTLVELDRERTAGSKLNKQLDLERKASATQLVELQGQVQTAQFQLARQSQELGGYMAKAELLADERDRAARHAADSARYSAELGSQLSAERARVTELRGRLERKAPKSTSPSTELSSTPAAPRQRRPTRNKLNK
ncbi:DNA-binding protein [Massilia timonae]|uniref:DNA-binding protein n=1 Tax=Massilia timonae TaxID=47229 RepID=UPI0028D6ADDB|nr:DNA-binding protein [Massilia timonae]